jgi:hypothetical protein
MSELTHADREALAAERVHTAEQLTSRAVADPKFLVRFGDEAAQRMRSVVASVALRRSKPFLRRSHSFTEGNFRKHGLDLFVLVCVMLVLAGFWRDLHVPTPGRAVVGESGIGPFHVIGNSDIRHSCKDNDPPDPKFAQTLVGHYSLEYLKPCDSIDPKKLSSGPPLSAELNGRILVRLKVQVTTIFSGMHPPFRAALMVSPHERATTALLLNDLMVLDLRKDGDGLSAVVAITPADESFLASYVARSDLVLVAGHP